MEIEDITTGRGAILAQTSSILQEVYLFSLSMQ
jgi:hypothetical protein